MDTQEVEKMKNHAIRLSLLLLVTVVIWSGAGSVYSSRSGWETDQPASGAMENSPAGGTSRTTHAGAPQGKAIQGLTAEEERMIGLINRERTAAGLPVLEADMRIVATAREKARDMTENHYFDHRSPELGSPFDQIKAAGIQYGYAGENLADAATPERAHKALMNSPTHRANILFDQYTHIGVGVVDGGPHGKMFVQHFILKP